MNQNTAMEVNAVVVDEPDVIISNPPHFVEGQFLDANEFDQINEQGKLAGEAAGKLFFSHMGRTEADKTIAEISQHLEEITPFRLFASRKPSSQQILYRIDLNTSGAEFHDKNLEQGRQNLKRARQILGGAGGVIPEDNQPAGALARKTFEKGVETGWKEAKQKNEFPDEKPEQRPWYFKVD